MKRGFVQLFMLFLVPVFFLILSPASLVAQVRFAGIFSDHMVLQAEKPIRIWGRAGAGERVRVFLNEQQQAVKADKNGKWSLVFPAMAYGDTVRLKATGKTNEVVCSDVLVGDVWLCSGQSNMAMTINGGGGQVYNYKNEESNANYPLIRSYKVGAKISPTVGVDVEGVWEVCSPQTVSEFSAVAYFFARKIHQETGLPIGIINSSWGGTDIETWMSREAYQAMPTKIRAKYQHVESIGIEAMLKENEVNRKHFMDLVATDAGMKEQWYAPSFQPVAWEQMTQPQEWGTTALAPFDGVVWFRYEFNVLEADAGQPGVLSFGKVDDHEITWLNGVQIGATHGAGYERTYPIPAHLLKNGKNVLTVRVIDAARAGGFTGTAEQMYIDTEKGRYSLAGDWLYKATVDTRAYQYEEDVINLYHSMLYNAMIEPLTDFAIKGSIWYQGENNAGRAYHYRTLFPALIHDWRTQWASDFPFYWVQLASWMPKAEVPPVADSWAELREAQTFTLSVAHTGQAITTDIGDANDIHPRNKQDVGVRLAYIALNKDYGKSDIVYSGPTYQSMKVEKDRIVITFDNVASGLQVSSKYGYIEGFAIAGADQQFVWAKAELDGPNRVVVFADEIKTPVAVRYCWAINPDVNLYNSAGLPAAPFRTDTWRLSTED